MKKFISFFLVLLLLFSTIGCSTTQDKTSVTNTDDTQKDQSLKVHEEQKELYDDIIAHYTTLLTLKQRGEELPTPNTANMSQREAAIFEALYGIVNGYKNAQSVETLGYGYKDFDKNGTPELIILTQYTSIRAIFTISNGEPVLLESSYDAGSSFVFATKNRFFIARSTVNNNIEEAIFYTCRVEGDKMVYDAVYGKVYDQSEKEILDIFQITDDNRVSISEDDFNELYREH